MMKKFISLTAAVVMVLSMAVRPADAQVKNYVDDDFSYTAAGDMFDANKGGWKNASKGAASVSLKEGSVELAANGTTAGDVAEIQKTFASDSGEFVIEFDLKLNYTDSTNCIGVQIFDGAGNRSFAQISKAGVNLVGVQQYAFPIDTQWYTYRIEVSSGGVSWYWKPRGTEEYKTIAHLVPLQKMGSGKMLKFFVEKTTNFTSTIDNVKITSYDSIRNMTDSKFTINMLKAFTFTDSENWNFTKNDNGVIEGEDGSLRIEANGSTKAQVAQTALDSFGKLIWDFDYTLEVASANSGLKVELSTGEGNRARIHFLSDKVNWRDSENTAWKTVPVKSTVGTLHHGRIILECADREANRWLYSVYVDDICVVANYQAENFASAKTPYIKIFAETDPSLKMTVSNMKVRSGRETDEDFYINETFYCTNREMALDGWKIDGNVATGLGEAVFQEAGILEKGFVPKGINLQTTFALMLEPGGDVAVTTGSGTENADITIGESGVSTGDTAVQDSQQQPGVWYRYKLLKSAGGVDVYRLTGNETEYTLIAKDLPLKSGPAFAGISIAGSGARIRELQIGDYVTPYSFDGYNYKIAGTMSDDFQAGGEAVYRAVASYDKLNGAFSYQLLGGEDLTFTVSGMEKSGAVTFSENKITYDTAEGTKEVLISSEAGTAYELRFSVNDKDGYYSFYRKETGSDYESAVFENVRMCGNGGGPAVAFSGNGTVNGFTSVSLERLYAPDYMEEALKESSDVLEMSGWEMTVPAGGAVFAGGVMSIGEHFRQAYKQFTPLTDTYTVEFDTILHYEETDDTVCSMDINSGKNRLTMSISPNALKVITQTGEKRIPLIHENGVTYRYRAEQSRGMVTILRKADGGVYETAAEGIALPEDTQAAGVRLVYGDGAVGGKFKNLVISGMLPRPVEESHEALIPAKVMKETFDDTDIAARGWQNASDKISVSDGMLRLKADGNTAVQQITKNMDSLENLVYEMRYRFNTPAGKLGFMMLDTEKRAVIMLAPNSIAYRESDTVFPKVDIENAVDVWYTLRTEVYTDETGTARYSIFRKADGEERYTAIVDGAPLQIWDKEQKTYLKYFIEQDGDADISIDDIRLVSGDVLPPSMEYADGAAEEYRPGETIYVRWGQPEAASLLRPVNKEMIGIGAVGIYNENGALEMLEAAVVDEVNRTVQLTLPEDASKAYTVSAMLWEGLETMRPLMEKYTKRFTE